MMRTRLVALSVLTVLVVVATQVLDFGGDDGEGGRQAEPTTTTTERRARPTTTTANPRPTTTTTAPPCRPDGRTTRRDGIRVREFCGPGRAVLHVGEQVYDFQSGTCRRHRRWWQLSLGVVVLENRPRLVRNPRFTSFSLMVGRHPGATEDRAPASGDGSYNEGDVTFTVPGSAYAMKDVTIVLSHRRTRGELSGTALRAGQAEQEEPLKVRGRFVCKPDSPGFLDRFRDEGPTTTAG